MMVKCLLLLDIKITCNAVTTLKNLINLKNSEFLWRDQLQKKSVSSKPQLKELTKKIFDTSPMWWREASLCPRLPKKIEIQETFKQTETSWWTRHGLFYFSDENNFDQDQKTNRRNNRQQCFDLYEVQRVMQIKFPGTFMVLGC